MVKKEKKKIDEPGGSSLGPDVYKVNVWNIYVYILG